MSEKTEEATPKKKREARKKGQVAKSAEFTAIFVMLSAIAVMVSMGVLIIYRLAGFTLQSIEIATRPELEPGATTAALYESLEALLFMLGPLVGVTFVAAAFITYIQVGPLFTLKPVIPDMNKLNPAQGMKNLFSMSKVVELIKNVGKLSVMGALGTAVIFQVTPPMALTPGGHLLDAAMALSYAALRLSLVLVAGLVVFGVIDLIWKNYEHNKKLRMAKHEIKQEFKQSDGDPMMKGKRKQLHQELIQGSGLKEVQNADAVVVNPTHVAVALRYRQEEMGAPKVIAAGKGITARKIKKLARRYNIPIVHNVPLARALVEVGIEEEIPEEFFEPVAEVLRFVYELREQR